MKSVPENIKLSKDLSHQFPWSIECLIPPWTPSGGVEGQQLQQHRVQSPQGQMANALGKCQFVVDNGKTFLKDLHVFGWNPVKLGSSQVALMVKNPPVMQETIFGLGRSPRVENRNPLQYSCLENSMDRGAWLATVHGIEESRTWLIE